MSEAKPSEQLAVGEAKPGEQPAADAPRIEVVRGGEATPEELAALVVALTPTAGEPDVDDRRNRHAWQEAALLEGVGFRPFVSVDDVERYHRSLA